MRYLIISDTHNNTYYLNRVLNKVGNLDGLFHLGDFCGHESDIQAMVECDTYMIGGNNDFFCDLERELLVEIGSYRIFMAHGHRYGVGYGQERILEAGKDLAANIVMFGHTHKPLIMQKEGIYLINPGSISQPRQEGRIPTYIIMEFDRFGVVHFTLNYVD